MGTRSRAAVAALVFVASLAGSRVAAADPKGDINTKVKEAMESYDLMDYDAAKKSLNAAAATAKKAKLDKDAITAKIYLDLGIVAFAVPDPDGARNAFQVAVAIDPKIQIDPAYRSPDMAKLLDDARKSAKHGGGGGAAISTDSGPGLDSGGDSVDCSSVKGLQHSIIDTSRSNAPAAIEVLVGSDIKPAKVSVQYRAEGASDFTESKLSQAGCKYTGAIPASATHGTIVHYYVAAYDSNNKVIAAKGSAGSPNIMELTGGSGGGAALKGDEEDPLAGKHGGGGGAVAASTGDDASVSADSGTPAAPGDRHKVMLGVAVGTGFGYVTGNTEGGSVVKNCCLGSSLAVITPELSYAISPKTSIGVAARIGIPVGADVAGHATAAPGGLVRLRHGFSDSGDGIRVMGQLGLGVLRNTIKLDNAMSGQDTDIVAQGPLLLGAGAGYTKHLANNVVFLVDLSVLAGLDVANMSGLSPTLNSGLSADLSIGLAVGL